MLHILVLIVRGLAAQSGSLGRSRQATAFTGEEPDRRVVSVEAFARFRA
jgi:hypothetical protein